MPRARLGRIAVSDSLRPIPFACRQHSLDRERAPASLAGAFRELVTEHVAPRLALMLVRLLEQNGNG